MDVFKLFGQVIIETKDAIKALEETADEAKNTGESADKIGEGFHKNGEATKAKLAEIAKSANKTTDEVKREAEQIAKSYEEAGDDSATAMRKAYADIESASQQSGEGSNKSALDMVKSFGKVTAAAGAVVSAVVAIGKAMIELAESTREYRVEMGKLETAFVTVGYSATTATDTYRTLYSVLGETDQAVEAANMLARLCTTEEELTRMTKACTGIYATFGNSLPIEGLAEAANETAKIGTVTGQLADALNWVGLSEDDFNEKLAKCNTERERAVLITSALIDAYEGAAESYQENNSDITEAYLAQERLNEAIARWGALAEPTATAWKNFRADWLESWTWFLSPDYRWEKELENAPKWESDSITEVEERLAKLRQDLAILQGTEVFSGSSNDWQISALEEEIARLEQAYNDLKLASNSAAQAATDTTAEFTTATAQYIADATSLFEQFTATYEGIYSKVAGWFAPFEKAATSVQTNISTMMQSMQSQIDFNNAYTANLQALKEYGLGDLSEAFQAYGADGAAYAKTIVDAINQAGGATTEKGQEIINGFLDMNQQLSESQGELTQTMTLLNGEFETAMDELVDTYGITIEDLDKSAEARASARNTFQEFLNGINAEIPGILQTITKFGQDIMASLENGMGEITITVGSSNEKNLIKAPEHETGLDYVPYDNYLAYLHKGEAVLTAEEATAWRAGKETANGGESGGGVVVNQYIEAVPQTPVELASATAAYFEQARWVT